MPKEQRPIQMTFRVSQAEHECIKHRMKSLGICHSAAYLRKMALNGFILQLDIPEMKELVSEAKHIGNNVNQIAKVANSTGTVTEEEIRSVKEQMDKLWKGINAVLGQLNKIG